MDKNEGLLAAARRELEEETGITGRALVQTGAYGKKKTALVLRKTRPYSPILHADSSPPIHRPLAFSNSYR